MTPMDGNNWDGGQQAHKLPFVEALKKRINQIKPVHSTGPFDATPQPTFSGMLGSGGDAGGVLNSPAPKHGGMFKSL